VRPVVELQSILKVYGGADVVVPPSTASTRGLSTNGGRHSSATARSGRST